MLEVLKTRLEFVGSPNYENSELSLIMKLLVAIFRVFPWDYT